MLLSEMQEGVHYVVTKGSKDKTFQKGDKLYLVGGDIMNSNAVGWMSSEEVDYLNEVKVSISLDHYHKKFYEYQMGIDRFKELIQNSMTKEECEKVFKKFKLVYSFLKTVL